jgi:hypothetical protein
VIPLLAYLRVRNQCNRGFALWVPLVLVWVLLAPFVLLLLPLFFLVCALGEVDAWRALSMLWQVLAGFNGSDINVAGQETSISIRTF